MLNNWLPLIILIVVALCVVIAGLYFSDSAKAVWRATRSATIATALAPNDAGLRFAIGNYYFGGGAYDLG